MPERTPAAAMLERVRSYHADLTGIRRDIHSHPELGLETRRTADLVARLLKSWGIEVHGMVDGAGWSACSAPATAPSRSGCGPTWTRYPSTSGQVLPTPATHRVSCTSAVTTAIRRCCLARRATSLKHGNSMGPSTSYSNQERRVRAVRSPCCVKACSKSFPLTSSMGSTTVQACWLVTSASRLAPP